MIRLQGDRSTYLFDPQNANTCLRSNGRFSLIYLGKDESDGSTVVIKQLHPRLNKQLRERRRFMKEFHPYWDLPFITRSLDMVVAEEDLYHIREYKPGEDLQTWMEAGSFQRMSSLDRRRFIIQLLELVESLHNKGYIHGDIKPSNFILGTDGKLVMIDLGLSYSLQEKDRPFRDTTDPIPFSLMYSSPEQMLNFPELMDERSDIFSLGIMIYQLLTGAFPWEEKNPAVLMNLQLVYPLTDPGRIHGRLFRILQKMTARFSFAVPPLKLSEPEQRAGVIQGMNMRHRTIKEVKADLEALLVFQWKRRSFWAFLRGH